MYVYLESVVCWKFNPEGTMNVKQFVKSQVKFQIEWKNTCVNLLLLVLYNTMYLEKFPFFRCCEFLKSSCYQNTKISEFEPKRGDYNISQESHQTLVDRAN